jgi:hypothetical protein
VKFVARNRRDLERALSPITSKLLKEKGYLCFVDVFMRLGCLSQTDYENWRMKRTPYLERVLRLNLPTINFVMKTVRRNSLNGRLKPSLTVYKSWGKGKKMLLQFSKSGDPTIETAYATHFVKPKRADMPSDGGHPDQRQGLSLPIDNPDRATKDAHHERQNRAK